MKRVLLVLLIVVLLGACALAVFIATFDADRYRPQLVAQLEGALGRPVDLERVSLGWKQGIAVELRGLAIHADASRRQPPVLAAKSVQALVRLMPLLQRDVQVASVILQGPSVRVTRDAQGRTDLMGLAAAAGPAGGSGTAQVGDAQVTFNVASLRIENGIVDWTDDAARPPRHVRLEQLNATLSNIAPGRPMTVEASGALGAQTPNLQLRARVVLPDQSSPGRAEDVTVEIKGIPLEDFVPAGAPGAPRLAGLFSAALDVELPTFDPAQLASTLAVAGRLQLEQGRVANLNILRTVLERFSMVPGLMERLLARLPPSYQEKLAAQDTVLGPVDLPLRLEQGALRFDDLQIQTDTIALAGRGAVGLDGRLGIQALLRVDPGLTQALVRSVNELQALTNNAGQMEVPVALSGSVNQLAVQPDLQYVASKVIVTKVSEVLTDVLRKRFGPPEPQGESAPSGEAPPAGGNTAPEQDGAVFFGQLLRRALESGDPPAAQE